MNARQLLGVAVNMAALVGANCGLGQPTQLTVAQAATLPAAGTPNCGSAAFLNFEQGKLAAVGGVDAVERRQARANKQQIADRGRYCHENPLSPVL